MQKNRKIKSQLLILQTLKEKKSCSFKSLFSVLEKNEIIVNERTFQRYIKELKDNFFVQYNVANKSYEIDTLVDEEQLNLYVSILQITLVNYSIEGSFKSSKGNRKYIYSDTSRKFKGNEHLELIIKAIESSHQLSFTYLKQFNESSKRLVFPVFVKEYQNRWYLIAEDKNKNDEVRIFGLDRIENLCLAHKQKYIPENDYDVIFDKLIGVDTRGVLEGRVKSTDVVFKAYEQQKFYFKSLPLHPSQTIISETSAEAIFKIHVFPNYELKQHFFHFSPFVEVLEPKWLREEIKQDLQITLNKYS